MSNSLTDPDREKAGASRVPPASPAGGSGVPVSARFPFLAIVPWLMLASTMRFIGWRGGAFGLLTTVIADLCVFLALLVGTRAMVEWWGERMAAGPRAFRDQLRLGHKILIRVFALMVAVSTAVSLLASGRLGPFMMMGFDGIAFDQFSRLGMAWSAILGALVFLLVVQAETTGRVSLVEAARDLVRRRNWMLPAIVTVALLQLAMSVGQGVVRGWVYVVWQSATPETLKNFVYFGFVFGFATVRVWLTLAVLTLALRWSYRRAAGSALSPPAA